MRLSNGIVPFLTLSLILTGCGGAGSPEGSSPLPKLPEIPDGPVLQVGFGDRVFTPAGEPPEEWAQFFTPQAVTGIWGEPFVDANGDGCYNNSSGGGGESEAHTDQAWNSDATGQAFNVREVYIYGDEQSGGKWDGIWAGAGFGSQCGEGVLDDVQARGFVAEYDGTTVAVFSIDVVGFFNYEMKRIRSEMAARYPEMEIDEFIISSTHTHEAMDTMGYWGEQIGVDGKFPAFQAYVRSQIIDAVHDAWVAREPAKARFATVADTVPIRDSRPPIVIDKNLEVVQFAALDSDRILGTGVVYGNHPEAMGGDNGFLTSDYAHFIRVFLEEEFGGVGVLFTGSVGGLMTPLRVDFPGFGTDATYERTEEIGRLVAEEAIDGIKAAQYETVTTIEHNRRDVYMEADSTLLVTLNNAGVFDMPTYNGGDTWGGR